MHKAILPLAVFHDCGSLFVTSTEKHTVKVFQNRVPRTIFGPMSETGAEDRENRHNKYLSLLGTELQFCGHRANGCNGPDHSGHKLRFCIFQGSE